MRRRVLLTSVATIIPSVLAGCSALSSFNGSTPIATVPTARLTMTAMNDTELLSDGLFAGGITDTGPNADLLDRILDNGATVTETRPPLPEHRHLLYDGMVYRLSHTVIERTPATIYSVKVDIPEGSAGKNEDEDKTIRFDDLPAVDRQTFAENGLASGETIGVGTAFLYTDAERKRSVLVPESNYSYIVWEDGSRAEWIVDDATDTTLKTYRYTAKQIATAKEYGRRLRERFAFELSNLSDAQRDIIETTITEDQYLVASGETPPSALVSLADRFRNHEQAHRLNENGDGDLSGSYIVRYENTTYWTMFVVSSESFPTETPS